MTKPKYNVRITASEIENVFSRQGRCGACPNCKVLEQSQKACLRALGHPGKMGDADHVRMVWNDMLAAYPCQANINPMTNGNVAHGLKPGDVISTEDLAARIAGAQDFQPTDPRNTGLWALVTEKIDILDETIETNCLDNTYATELRQVLAILNRIFDSAHGTEADCDDDTGSELNATMLDDLGHAGQPGYVARKGDRVLIEPATNQPNGGYFIINGDHSIHVAQLDSIAELDEAYVQYLAETADKEQQARDRF